jgi:hypothetical protein
MATPVLPPDGGRPMSGHFCAEPGNSRLVMSVRALSAPGQQTAEQSERAIFGKRMVAVAAFRRLDA